ncbi:hypothetical protein [Cellulomonas cellasea]|uniref:Uncharacterized protein n=1 Tax=Cellulomonas cellasea TaxID=43670 RepID=A0A7W4UKJ1_9CELL|nr:hypothetical protein [Cellulomonas cellasea]MBB2925263.1 hypothetical protein [Cellulomonas cellasea]
MRSARTSRTAPPPSDEPADVLRDLAILAGPRAVPDLLRSDTRLDVAEVLAACDDALSRRVLGRSLPGLPAGDASDERALWALLDAGYDPWELFDRHCDAASTAYHDATVIDDGGGDGWWSVSRSTRSDLVRMARTATGDLSSLAPRLT